MNKGIDFLVSSLSIVPGILVKTMLAI